jgi:hypothetical protein
MDIDQLADQSREQPESPPRRPVPPQFVGKNFQPGVSGNPAGRVNPRVKMEIDRLIADFVAAFARAPNAAESATIGNAGLLLAKLAGRGPRGKALTPEEVAKLSNSVTRCLRLVGLARAPTRVAAAAPRRRTALEILNHPREGK